MKKMSMIATALAVLPLTAAAETADLSKLTTWSLNSHSVQYDADTKPWVSTQDSDEDLSKTLSSPNSPLSTLTFKHVYTQYKGSLPGASDQTGNVTQFQPGFPFPLGEGTNLFVRPLITYVWDQPVYNAGTNTWSSKSGFADVAFDLALGKNLADGWLVIYGVQGTIPTKTDVSGGQWRLGPEFAVAKMGKKAYGVFFPSHQWDISGDNYDYSTTSIELVGGVYLPNQWTLYSDNTILYDHIADQWTVPLNVSLKKVTKFGKTPVQLVMAVDYYLEQNDAFGQDWALRFQIAPVVNNFIYDMIKGNG